MLSPVVEIQRESREDRTVRIRGVDDDGDAVNPTADPVEIAFARPADRPVTWHSASWVPGGPFTEPTGLEWYKATLEIGGPSTGADVELAVGQWKVFARLTTPGDKPVIPAGTLIVH